jgi:hypothetical protein
MFEIEILLTFVYFLECTVVQCKDALSIYWNRHGHECSRVANLKIIYEGTESADIATNENILLLDEYSKVKLF